MPKSAPKASSEKALLRRAEAALNKAPESGIGRGEFETLLDGYRTLSDRLYKTLRISDAYQLRIKEMNDDLEELSAKLRQMREVVLPVCVRCRKVRSDDHYWQRMETFLGRNMDLVFSHGVCPECVESFQESLGPVQNQNVEPEGPLEMRVQKKTAEDKSVLELHGMVEQIGETNPTLAKVLDKFSKRYAKLVQRFAKTLTISDSYQSQLHDVNLRLGVLARTDLLTGLVNRWELSNRLDAERSRLERHGSCFCLLLGDLDHFKDVNDAHGHLCGDAALRHVSTILRANLRHEDLCARWGGEEFMILLPDTGLEAAKLVGEKLVALVRETPLRWSGQTVRMTMSFGVGECRQGMDIEKVIQGVDNALYAAKAKGRDRVESLPEDVPPGAVCGKE